MFASLRALVYLKRISRSLTTIAVSLETLAKVQVDRWERENVRLKPKPIVFGQMDIEEARKAHEQRQKEYVGGE